MTSGLLRQPKTPHTIRVYREAGGYSQTDLADRCGIPMMRLSRIERGIATPTEAELDTLARVLNAPRESLRLRI